MDLCKTVYFYCFCLYIQYLFYATGVVLKTLFYKNYFSIFFTPSIRFPSCKEVHPPKVFFGKTVWGRRKEPYVFLKPTPHQKEDVPRAIQQSRSSPKLLELSVFACLPCIVFASGELPLMSKGDFCDCIEYTLKIS